MSYRCLRAANRGLYLGTSLLVAAACGYTLWRGEHPAWQLAAAAAAGLITLLWGSFYVLLRYEVDAEGVTRRSLLGKRCLLWAELAEASVQEQEGMGVARCAIHLRSQGGASLCLSSDVLPLDEVEQLAADMRREGLLPTAAAEEP